MGLNGFEEVSGSEEVKFSAFLMVSELLKGAEERRDGTEKDCLRFWRDGHQKGWRTIID